MHEQMGKEWTVPLPAQQEGQAVQRFVHSFEKNVIGRGCQFYKV